MDLRGAIRRRHMHRALSPAPLPTGLVADLLDVARLAPSAGNTAAVSFVLLEGDEVERYWSITLPPQRRAAFAWPTLPSAPALVLVTTEPDAYPRRYAEGDKAATGLGEGLDRWPVPFWWVDAGCVVQNLLLLATEAGLGALLFGVFEHEDAVREALGIPDGVRIVAAVALGEKLDDVREGRSSRRRRPALAEVLHRGRWSGATGR